jgi:hypothetical protein
MAMSSDRASLMHPPKAHPMSGPFRKSTKSGAAKALDTLKAKLRVERARAWSSS